MSSFIKSLLVPLAEVVLRAVFRRSSRTTNTNRSHSSANNSNIERSQK
jgi:hypothetical protein